MYVAPPLWDVGQDLVMRPANELSDWGEPVIGNKPPRDGEVAHVAVEHGNRRWCVLHEHGELRLSCGEDLFSPFAFADIDKHVDSTAQFSGCVEKRCWVGDEGNAPAVWTLGYCFHATDGPSLLERHGHWALIMRQWRAIRLGALVNDTLAQGRWRCRR